MFMPPVCWRSDSTKASPTRPRPAGSLVPRAKMTSASGQLSADAVGRAPGMPLGVNSRTVAAARAAAPVLAQPPQIRERRIFTPKFYPLPGQTKRPELCIGCAERSAHGGRRAYFWAHHFDSARFGGDFRRAYAA